MTRQDDHFWLDRAFSAAEKIAPQSVSPNPRVGCVLVKNGREVAQAAHARFGQAHAEALVLAKVGRRAKGATAYVTMEPCAHFPGKKTPSCAEALAMAGVRRVVCATLDPNAAVSGRGLKLLRNAGIATENVREESRAFALNRGFFSRMRRERPWVILKTALSLDGKAATKSGASRWITGPMARAAGHAMRAQCDAVLVGSGTIRTDNPRLTAHGAGRNPLRVVFVGRRPISRQARVFDSSALTLVYQTRTTAALRRALKDLSGRGVGTVYVEGGPTIHAALLRAGLADEARIFLSPKLLAGAANPNRAPKLIEPTFSRLGDDWLFQGTLACSPE